MLSVAKHLVHRDEMLRYAQHDRMGARDDKMGAQDDKMGTRDDKQESAGRLRVRTKRIKAKK